MDSLMCKAKACTGRYSVYVQVRPRLKPHIGTGSVINVASALRSRSASFQSIPFILKHRILVVSCHAEPGRQPSLKDLLFVLKAASSAWEKYDKDRNGTMSLKECEKIFNSKELSDAFELLTNMPHRNYSVDDLEPFFKRADKDSSGTLSRAEFLALYLAVVGNRIKKNPFLLAEALLGFIDKDKNGVLEGKELKQLLLILGFAPIVLLPIPGFMKVDYRAILRGVGRVLEGSGNGGNSA